MMNECLKLDKLKVMSMLNRCWLSLEMPRTAPESNPGRVTCRSDNLARIQVAGDNASG